MIKLKIGEEKMEETYYKSLMDKTSLEDKRRFVKNLTKSELETLKSELALHAKTFEDVLEKRKKRLPGYNISNSKR